METNWLLTGNAGTNPTTDFLGTTDDQPLVFITNGSEKARLSPDGQLGIGTIMPAITDPIAIIGDNNSRLSITLQNTNESGNASVYAQNDRGNFDSYGGFFHGGTNVPHPFFGNSAADKTVFISDGVNSEGMAIGTLTEKPLILGTNNTEQARILPNGNIGIGTDNPQAKLHIGGNLIIDSEQTIVACSGSGNVSFSQPIIGASYKKVVIYLDGATNPVIYDFPYAFSKVPGIITTSGVSASVVTSISETSVAITGGSEGTTGFIFLEGY